jgi:hypothetical protein
MDLVGPLQEAQEAELGAGSGIASPYQSARQLLPEISPYTYRRPNREPPAPLVQVGAEGGGGLKQQTACRLVSLGFRRCLCAL